VEYDLIDRLLLLREDEVVSFTDHVRNLDLDRFCDLLVDHLFDLDGREELAVPVGVTVTKRQRTSTIDDATGGSLIGSRRSDLPITDHHGRSNRNLLSCDALK